MQTLLALAREHVAADNNAAWDTLGLAATAAYQAGDPDSVDGVADVMAALPPATDIEPQAARAWALAVTGHNLEAEALLRDIRQTVSTETGLHHAGAAAWLRDQTADAIRLLDAARNASADPAVRAASGGSLAALGWAYFDAGRWDDALELIAGTGNEAAGDITAAAGTLITATVEAARGNTDRARELVLNALAADPEQSRVITARARHALGLCALADDDYLTAFEQLRPLFGPDGTPYHPHVSYLAAGDLALAAARADRGQEGREIVKQIAELHATAASWPSARLRQLLTRADCVLADPSTPDAYPDDVLSDPAGEQMAVRTSPAPPRVRPMAAPPPPDQPRQTGPQRRPRRVPRARVPPVGAPHGDRAARLRDHGPRCRGQRGRAGRTHPAAAGDHRTRSPGANQPRDRPADALVPPDRPSHLHRSFPKLGVAGRLQLHAVITPADPPGQTATGSDHFRQLPRQAEPSQARRRRIPR